MLYMYNTFMHVEKNRERERKKWNNCKKNLLGHAFERGAVFQRKKVKQHFQIGY